MYSWEFWYQWNIFRAFLAYFCFLISLFLRYFSTKKSKKYWWYFYAFISFIYGWGRVGDLRNFVKMLRNSRKIRNDPKTHPPTPSQYFPSHFLFPSLSWEMSEIRLLGINTNYYYIFTMIKMECVFLFSAFGFSVRSFRALSCRKY